MIIEAPRSPLLRSLRPMPDIRARLHSICALYAHTAHPRDRIALLDVLEDLALETAAILASELLECGWRPDSAWTSQTISPSSSSRSIMQKATELSATP